MGSILNLKTIPEVGGDTLFASMYAAYDALSAPMKAVPVGTDRDPRRRAELHRAPTSCIGKEGPKEFPRAEHPVIRTHPVTGRSAVFVNPVFTVAIKDVPEDESKAILEFLYEHCARPHWQVRFRWQPHSVAFWDNRCVQHIAMWDYYPQVRSGLPRHGEGRQAVPSAELSSGIVGGVSTPESPSPCGLGPRSGPRPGRGSVRHGPLPQP